ncbi:unnamed protein product [Closterium sp. NIES-53]
MVPSPLAMAPRNLPPLTAAPVPCCNMVGEGVARGGSSCPRALQSHAQLRPRPPPPPQWGWQGEAEGGRGSAAPTGDLEVRGGGEGCVSRRPSLSPPRHRRRRRRLRVGGGGVWERDGRVARYSSPATAALSRLMLPYLFPDLAAFATVADLITHLCTSDARYHSVLPTEFCAKNPPPMYITLYYLVIRLPDSLASVRDQFLSLYPTELTLDLLEERLTAAEKSIVAVGASRGDPRAPSFEGCAPVPLLPSVASAAAVDLVRTEEVGTASALSGRRRTSKGNGGKGGGGDGGGSGGSGGGGGGVAVEVGVVAGVGASVSAVGVVHAAAAVVEVAAAVELVEAEPRSGSGGSQRQQQPRSRESPSAQQLREWYAGRGRSGGVGPCTYVLRTGGCRGETCGLGDLLKQNVAIFDLDFDAILAATYAMTDSAEGDCYLCVLPDPSIEATALGASESAPPGTSDFATLGTSESAAPGAGEFALSGTSPSEALHTFTLDSGASRSFFRDSTTLTPLSRPVAVSLADPSGDPVLAHSSTVLLGAHLQDVWVDQFTPGGQCVTHCTCSRTGRHLATFTRRPGSSLYTLTTASPPVTASGQVAASSQVFAAASRSSPASALCSCCPLSHETLLWHHRLGHPSLPRLQGMASQAPLQTLHMDVWGPARVCGQGHERYFLLVVDDYSRYTTVFPLRRKVRGGEFSSDLLRAFCRAEGIRQTFTLLASPQQNGIAKRRIGMVMDVARTSMIHAAAPHFLWPFEVQYAAHQINLQPRVSLPETTPTLRWTGKVGDACVFRVLGSQAFVHDTSTEKLSSRAVPCVFLGFPPDASGWQFYHPTSCRVLSSPNVTFDESVSYYCVSQVDPVEPVEVAVDSGAARGTEPAGAGPWGAVLGVAESEGAEPGGAEPGRVEPGGAEPGGAESWGAEPGGAEPERAASGGPPGVPSWREPLSPQRLCEWYARCCRRAAGATGPAVGGAFGTGAAGGAAGSGAAGAAGPGGTAAGGTGAVGGPTGVGAAGGASGAGAAEGAAGAGAAGAAGLGGAGAGGAGAVGGPVGVGAAGGSGAAGPGGARTGGTGAAGAGGASGVGAVGTGVVATGAGDPGAEGTGAVSAVSGGAARPRAYYAPLLRQVLGLLPSTSRTPPLLSPPPVQSQSQLQPASTLPGPSPYSGPTRGLTEHREPESRPASPESHPASPASRLESPVCAVRTGRHRVPLPSPPASSLPDGPDPESDSFRAASPTVTRFLATASLTLCAASALVTELVDFAAACCLDYFASLVAESESASVCSPSIGGECALGTDVLEDRQEEFECFAAALPHLVSMLRETRMHQRS